jgi:hypothetical protein
MGSGVESATKVEAIKKKYTNTIKGCEHPLAALLSCFFESAESQRMPSNSHSWACERP